MLCDVISKWYTTRETTEYCNIPEASCTRASFKGFFKNDMIQAECREVRCC